MTTAAMMTTAAHPEIVDRGLGADEQPEPAHVLLEHAGRFRNDGAIPQ